MRIEDVAFCTTVWDTVPATEHKGETGTAIWRTLETGNVRVRMVEYTPGYRAIIGAAAAMPSSFSPASW